MGTVGWKRYDISFTVFSINLKNKRVDDDEVIPRACRLGVRNVSKILHVNVCLLVCITFFGFY